MLAYEPVLKAAKEYAGDPVPFLYAVFTRLLMVFLAAFSALAIVFVVMFLTSSLAFLKNFGLAALGVACFAVSVAFIYMWAAFKGAMVKSFLVAEGGAVHMRNYLKYAFDSAARYFAIFVMKNSLLVMVNAPIIFLFLFFKPDLLSLPSLVLLLLGLLLSFVINFLFSFSYIAAAVKDYSPMAALKNSLRFVAKNPLPVLALSVAHELTMLLLLVPVLNIFVLITFHPTLYVLMINLYKSKAF